MHREIGADAVAGAMVEIKPRLPQRLAGKRINLRARYTFREDRGVNRDMALQHSGEAVFHLGRCGPNHHGAGDVGSAVLILRA